MKFLNSPTLPKKDFYGARLTITGRSLYGNMLSGCDLQRNLVLFILRHH